jgi:hypothetical protein
LPAASTFAESFVVSMMLRTGGQTGVDRAALDFAIAHGIAYCGWCPRGGLAEDFPEPPGLLALYPRLVETPSADSVQRTAWNVRDSHATLILLRGRSIDQSPGSRFTRTAAELIYLRPCRVVDIASTDCCELADAWLSRTEESQGVSPFVLNIAGPRESGSPGIYDETLRFLGRLFDKIE